MSKLLKRTMLNTIAIAIITMLLGSNVEYTINNYGILNDNVSYAEMEDTGVTEIIELEEIEDGTLGEFLDETGPDGEVIKVNPCKSLPKHGYGQYYALHKKGCIVQIKFSVKDISFEIKRGEKQKCRLEYPCNPQAGCNSSDETPCKV